MPLFKKHSSIGPYSIGKTLGKGRYSKVKKAVHRFSQQHYAIKVLCRKSIEKDDVLQETRLEISILNLLDHPNVIKLHQVLEDDKRIYLVLDMASGGDLFDKIQFKSKLREEEARIYFRQLISGVEYIHSQGVAHRDLKPENLIFGEDGLLKICDFGFASLAQGVRGPRTMKTVCGTPNYVAPEVLARKGYQGFPADVWSCGVVLFAMLCGELPFEDDNRYDLFEKIKRGQFTIPAGLSPEAKNLIRRILTVNWEERATIPEIKEHPWFREGLQTSPTTTTHADHLLSPKSAPLSISIPSLNINEKNAQVPSEWGSTDTTTTLSFPHHIRSHFSDVDKGDMDDEDQSTDMQSHHMHHHHGTVHFHIDDPSIDITSMEHSIAHLDMSPSVHSDNASTATFASAVFTPSSGHDLHARSSGGGSSTHSSSFFSHSLSGGLDTDAVSSNGSDSECGSVLGAIGHKWFTNGCSGHHSGTATPDEREEVPLNAFDLLSLSFKQLQKGLDASSTPTCCSCSLLSTPKLTASTAPPQVVQQNTPASVSESGTPKLPKSGGYYKKFFMAAGDAEVVAQRVYDALMKTDVQPEWRLSDSRQLRCFVPNGQKSSILQHTQHMKYFRVSVIPVAGSECSLVQFCRGKWSVLQFNEFYEELAPRLFSLLQTPQKE